MEHVDIGSRMELSERGEQLPPVRSTTFDFLVQTCKTATQASSNDFLFRSSEVLNIMELVMDLHLSMLLCYVVFTVCISMLRSRSCISIASSRDLNHSYATKSRHTQMK